MRSDRAERRISDSDIRDGLAAGLARGPVASRREGAGSGWCRCCGGRRGGVKGCVLGGWGGGGGGRELWLVFDCGRGGEG
jgi:hypothetical protein